MTAGRGVPSEPPRVSGAHAGDGRHGRMVTCAEDGLSAYLSLRPRLFRIVYGMLGSAVEAEDVVQDVWLRWQTARRGRVRDATAFLVTTAKRLAINVMHSARLRRETSVGARLLAPVDRSADPRLQANAAGATLGVRILWNGTPNERAAFVLREALTTHYSDIRDHPSPRGPTRRWPRPGPGSGGARRAPRAKRLFEAFIAPRNRVTSPASKCLCGNRPCRAGATGLTSGGMRRAEEEAKLHSEKRGWPTRTRRSPPSDPTPLAGCPRTRSERALIGESPLQRSVVPRMSRGFAGLISDPHVS